MHYTRQRIHTTLAIVGIALSYAMHTQAQRHLSSVSFEHFGSTLAINPTTNLVYAPIGIGFDASVEVIEGNPSSPSFNRIIDHIDLPNDSYPWRIAVNSETNRAYLLDSQWPRLNIINTATNAYLGFIALDTQPGSDVAVNSATNRIYITQATGKIVVVDGKTNIVETTIQLPYENAIADRLVVNATSNRVYVTDPLGIVNVIDASNSSVVASMRIGFLLFDIAVNPITDRVYVANTGDSAITVIRGSTNSIEANVYVGGFCRGVAVNPLRGRVYVFMPGSGVTVLDGRVTSPSYNNLLSKLDYGIFGWDSAINSTTNIFYVSNYSLELFDDPLSPIDGIAALIRWVSSLNLMQGIENSLDAKLTSAQGALESVRGGDGSTACNKLDSFISEVHAQEDKQQLSSTQVRELTVEAELIKAALGCR